MRRGVAFLVGWFSVQTVAIYYARDVLGSANYYTVMAVVQTVGIFAAAASCRVSFARSARSAASSELGVIARPVLGIAFAPASVPAVAIVFFGVLGVGLGGVNTLIVGARGRHCGIRRVGDGLPH